MPQVKLISPMTKQDAKKMRAAAYCRVSSNSADQQNSYANQIRHYTRMISDKPEWELVEVFADEGLSGMQAENRTEFQRMIRMCELRQIDIIITKSVSRFARNVKESLEYTRKLKLLGIGVQFEKEGINTLSMGDEMLLNTFSAIAQEESKAISQNQRLSIVKRMELGEYVDSNAPYGFRLVNKKLEVYEPEAKVVHMIFRNYLSGMSTAEIARDLCDRKIPTKTGTGKWRSTSVAYILSNERYAGDCLYQKTYRENIVPFNQHENHGQADMYHATETHAPLLDKEIFASAQKLLQSRKEHFNRVDQQYIYPLTGRIRCSECGRSFRRKMQSGTVKWVCATHEEDFKACPSSYYAQERIYDGFTTMINKLRFGEEDILGTIISKLEDAILIHKRNNTEARDISQNIATLNSKLMMLDQLHSKGYLAMEVYQPQTQEIRRQLNSLRSKRQDAFESRLLAMLQQVKELKDLLMELEEPLSEFDEKLFQDVVKEMTLNKEDELTITLLGGLKFTELI